MTPLPTWRADFLDRLLLVGAHRPVAGAACDPAHEIAQQSGAVRRVHHFEVELGGVEFARLVGDHGDRRVRRGGDDAKAFGEPRHAIAMAHPHRIFFADLPDAVEDCRGRGDVDLGAAELAVMAAFDLAAELMRHRLLAIADAKHRHARLIKLDRRQRRVVVEHGRRAAGEDHGPRLHLGEGFARALERHDLAVDAFLAHAPRNQLRDLRAEIDDEKSCRA